MADFEMVVCYMLIGIYKTAMLILHKTQEQIVYVTHFA